MRGSRLRANLPVAARGGLREHGRERPATLGQRVPEISAYFTVGGTVGYTAW
jgi:hypothetical protein